MTKKDSEKTYIELMTAEMARMLDFNILVALGLREPEEEIVYQYPATQEELFKKYKDKYERLSKLELSELQDMVLGQVPLYAAFEDVRIKKYGKYTGGFVEKWSWDTYAVRKSRNKNTLIEVYLICFDSWGRGS